MQENRFMSNLITILLLVVTFIISEIIYFFSCYNKSQKTIKKEWMNYKLSSVIFSLTLILILIFAFYGTLWLIRLDWQMFWQMFWLSFKESLLTLLICTIITIAIILYFYLNYKLGMSVAKKLKAKKR